MCDNAHAHVPLCVKANPFFYCVYFLSKSYPPTSWLIRLYLSEGNTEGRYYKPGQCTNNNSNNNSNYKLKIMRQSGESKRNINVVFSRQM